MRRLRAGLAASLLLLLGPGAPSSSAAPGDPGSVLVFGAEGDDLNAYDAYDGFKKQTVIYHQSDEHPDGRNINGQICFFPDGSRRFIAGEDTDQGDNRPQGWGIFQLKGTKIGKLSAPQVGRLVPTFVTTDASNPENYSCGFLSGNRIITTDVGDQFPGQPATGQLIVWFAPFDVKDVAYCKVDVSIATAGGSYIDKQGRIYVASNRPDEANLVDEPGGVYRYSGQFPTGPDAAGGCGRKDATGAPLVTEGRVTKELHIPMDQRVLTPSAVIGTGKGTVYVSSVFSGHIAEYDEDSGAFIRVIMEPPGGLPIGQLNPGITPFGMGLDSLGTLYVADLGIRTVQPAPNAGSEVVIRFDEDGQPQAPEKYDTGLNFPEGIGVLEIAGATSRPPTTRPSNNGSPNAGAGSRPRTNMPATGGGAYAVAGLAALLVAAAALRRVRRP